MGAESPGRLQFGLLGPVEAWRDGQPLRLGGERQRALLALLVLHANELVRTEALVTQLFGEERSEAAVHALRVAVSRLRRLLQSAQGREAIETRPGGYVLTADDEQLDTAWFERLLGEGRVLLAAGDARGAAARLREALALWRGTPLADVALVDYLQPEIRRLEELRGLALMERIDADLALGAGGDLTEELQSLVAANPLQERPRGQLMLALYRAGRQVEALAVYRETSNVLRDELGLEPSRALQALERSILEHDASLEPVPAPAPAPASNLPVPATPFLGRARELIDVTSLLQDANTRLLTLTGAGGSGKTRLAVRAAEASASDYPDGAWFVGFADISDPELIAPVICETLGLADKLGLTPSARLREWLRGREVLLVLDNLEQLADGSAVLGQLTAACPGLRLLVTSREPLRLAGEQQYEVPVLARGDAIELFISRAGAVAPSLMMPTDLPGEICERLDCLPLAIELAAARTKALPPAEILNRLDQRLPVLATGPRDAPRRQRTLTATIEWSYDLLTGAEQRLFVRLAVFTGGCTLAAAEAVCDARLDTLLALVDRSLLRADGNRYRMLQLLREYALEKLDDSDEAPQLRAKHVRWYTEVCDAEALKGFDERPHPDELIPDLENFRSALESAAADGDTQTVARLSAPLTRSVWTHQGKVNEAARWLRLAREQLSIYPLLLQAGVLSASCDVAILRGEYDEAAALSERALAIYRERGRPADICSAITVRGRIAAEQGDLEGDRAALEEAIQVAREHDVPGFLPVALVNLGDLAIEEGRLDDARALCEEAIERDRDRGLPADQVALINLAHVANLQGRHRDATDLGRQAFRAAIDRGDRVSAAAAAKQIAWPLAEEGQLERSGWLLGAAIGFSDSANVTKQRTDVISEQAACNALRDQLDEQAVQALLLQGREMSLEDAAQIEPDVERATGIVR